MSGPEPRAHVNVGQFAPAYFINALKTLTPTFSDPSDAGRLDADGYPTTTLAGTISLSGSTTVWPGVQYKLAWPSTRTFQMFFVGVCTLVSSSNATTSGGAANNMTVQSQAGKAGYVIFTTTSPFFIQMQHAGTFAAGSGEVALYRVSDEAAYLAGEYFTPEYIRCLKGLGPRSLRMMPFVNAGPANLNNEVSWGYRAAPSRLSWARQFPPGAYGGALAGTDTYTGTSAGDTPGSWTDGEQWIGYAPNANTSSVVTIDIGGRGAKSVVSGDGVTALAAGSIAANAIGTYTYDGVLDKVLFVPGGITGSLPIEAQVQLANRVGCHLWTNIPAWANDNYVTQLATVVRDGLDSTKLFFPEYSNEVWNFGFPQTAWASKRGQAFGWSTSSNQAIYGYYGLRVRQIMGNLIPAVFSGLMTRLKRVMAYQGGGDVTNINNRFKGVQLTPGNTAYNAFTGSANYSVSPNRPIDVCEVLAYAPYVGGSQLCYGPDNNFNYTPTVWSNQSGLQAIVTAYESGDVAGAIALVDDDIRRGRIGVQTVTASGTVFSTPADHELTVGSHVWFSVVGGTLYSGLVEKKLYYVASVPTSKTFTIQGFTGNSNNGSTVNAGSAGTGTVSVGRTFTTMVDITTFYLFGEICASTFDGDRPSGMSNLQTEQYEGGLEPAGPSSAQCTSIGLTGTAPSASVAAAITAWKNDTKARQCMIDYFKEGIGIGVGNPTTFGSMPHAKAVAALSLTGLNVWSLIPSSFPDATPYQTYYGFNDFSLSIPYQAGYQNVRTQ